MTADAPFDPDDALETRLRLGVLIADLAERVHVIGVDVELMGSPVAASALQAYLRDAAILAAAGEVIARRSGARGPDRSGPAG